MKNNLAAIAILVSGLLFAFFVIFIFSSNGNDDPAQNQNVHIESGKQIIDLTAKGGYSPRVSVAKAGMETVLRVKTNGTFDCSSTIAIPELDYRSHLTPSGITEITIPAQQPGKNIQGFCAMGMYNFNIQFN